MEPMPGFKWDRNSRGEMLRHGIVKLNDLVRDRLPGGGTAWQKGLIFSGLLLLMNSDSVRQPMMDVLVGVPGDVALAQALEPWLIQPSMGLLIALVLEFRRFRNVEVAN